MSAQPVETTLYSLSDAAPAPADRRDGDRHMTLYRVGSLLIDDRRELCLIKNISAGGMMVRAYCEIAEGTRLSIELKCGEPIAGWASWVSHPNVGISFDAPIDVLDILTTSTAGPRPRMPRIEVVSFATLRDGASLHRVRTCDVSQGGLKLSCETALAPETDVVVTLPGLDPQAAVIRWSDGEYMGLTFNRLLTLSQLIEWIQQQRDSDGAAS